MITTTQRALPRILRTFASLVGLASFAGLTSFAVACQPHSAAVGDPTPTTSGSVDPAAPPLFAVAKTHIGTSPGGAGDGTPLVAKPGNELAAFAEGCFWGSENTFRHVDGVVATAVGYAGGHTSHPTYEEVSSHGTGHAETVLVEFDPKRVTYAKLLQAFWDTHDPTTLNRQGPDEGENYRSEVFFFSPEQQATVRASMAEEQKRYAKPITTRVEAMGPFWKAEGYHQQYDEKTGRESCPLPHRKGS
jgi:peptide-methionine (S)-S-oxide reductase